VSEQADVPREILAKLRTVCLGLPEAYEEQAWVGTRWRVRKRTFAHVLVVDAGRPPGYARAVGSDGPVVVLMFRSSGPELDALRHGGRPFFAPRWRSDEVGMVLGEDIDCEEVVELLTESYCVQAPAKLADLIDRPSDS
jgi:hypothetical protein